MWAAGKVLHGSVFLPGFVCVQGPICLRSVVRVWLVFDGIKQAVYLTGKVAVLCMLGFSAGRGDPSSFAQLDLPA